jgi:hypothetical protein
MSDFLAIGGASETMRLLLEDRMELPNGLNSLDVTIGAPRPGNHNQPASAESPRVNLFLYRVGENGALKNQEIPGRGTSSGYGTPPLSLELFYLVTGHGSTMQGAEFDETPAHFLLGSAMRVLHDFPMVTGALLSARPPAGEPILHPSLRDDFERLKITLDPVSLEDLSKVWTALTLPFRVAAAYHVSLVQIESRRRRTFPQRVQLPPAAGPHIQVVPFRHPQIERLSVIRQDDPLGVEQPYPYARILDRLVLHGANLDGINTIVRVGQLSLAVGPTAKDRIEFVVPDNSLPDGTPISLDERLQPGPQTVSVRHAQASLPGGGFSSNEAVLMLTPRVTGVTLPGPRTLRITGTRLFEPSLPGEAVIGRAVVSRAAYLPASSGTQIEMPIPNAVVAWHVRALAAASPAFPLPAGLPLAPLPIALDFTIGTDGPRTARLPRLPTSLADFAKLLENALQIATDGAGDQGGRGFTSARVTTTQDNRLLLVPGDYSANMAVANTPEAQALGLGAGGPQAIELFLSGELVPFPELTASGPRFRLTVGAVAHELALANRPASLGEAARLLETAIRTFPELPFAGARVATLSAQLAFHFPGAAPPIQFETIPDVDALSALELELVGRVRVRVRVNGAESLETVTINLTA